jgi:hypothetical protein
MVDINDIVGMYPDDDIIKADGFDECILGIESDSLRLIYSVSKVCSALEDQGMSEFEAKEYFSFNIESASVGEGTPIWCYDAIG